MYLYLMRVTAFLLADEDYYKKRVVAVRPGLIRPSTHSFMLNVVKNKDVAVRARKDFNVGGSSTKVIAGIRCLLRTIALRLRQSVNNTSSSVHFPD